MELYEHPLFCRVNRRQAANPFKVLRVDPKRSCLVLGLDLDADQRGAFFFGLHHPDGLPLYK